MITTIAALLIALAVMLSGGAIIRNGVPLAEPPGPVKRLMIYLTRNTARTRAGHELPELQSRTYRLPLARTLELAHGPPSMPVGTSWTWMPAGTRFMLW